MRRVRDCRVVVTCSYHAAVFALAQGIPVVGLAASEYYVAKFEGLIAQFGAGCRLVHVDQSDFPLDLAAAIDEMWESGDDVRATLRTAAASQIEQSRGAYQSMMHMVPEMQRRPLAWFGRRRDARLGVNFNCADQNSANWDERARTAVSLLCDRIAIRDPAGQPLVIGDFGAGNERVRELLTGALAVAHEYHAYDLMPQQPTTTKIDFDQELPSRHFDAVFCLGLLEYLHDPGEFLGRLSRVCDFAVVSYVVFDGDERLSATERRERGWLTDLTREGVEAQLQRVGFQASDSAVVNRGRTRLWAVERQE